MKVSLDIHALQLWVKILIDEDEVRVDLKAPIFAKYQPNLEALVCPGTGLGHGPVLDQGRGRHLATAHLDT